MAKAELPDDKIPDDLVICDIAVGAGAFLLQFARIVANISGQDKGRILENHVIGFDIDSQVLKFVLCASFSNEGVQILIRLIIFIKLTQLNRQIRSYNLIFRI